MPLVCAHEDIQTVPAAAFSSDNAKTGRYTLDLGSIKSYCDLSGCFEWMCPLFPFSSTSDINPLKMRLSED